MLVLTRRVGDSIRIGDEVVITVLEIKGGQVQVGVSAPKGIRILRGEIYERVRQENVRSAGSSPADFERIRRGLS